MVFLKDKYDGKKTFLQVYFFYYCWRGLRCNNFYFHCILWNNSVVCIINNAYWEILFKPIYETLTYPITKYIINYIKSLPDY